MHKRSIKIQGEITILSGESSYPMVKAAASNGGVFETHPGHLLLLLLHISFYQFFFR